MRNFPYHTTLDTNKVPLFAIKSVHIFLSSKYVEFEPMQKIKPKTGHLERIDRTHN